VNADYATAYVSGMQEGEDPRYLKVGATCKHAFGYSLEGDGAPKAMGGGGGIQPPLSILY
jgi:hypothetical protein